MAFDPTEEHDQQEFNRRVFRDLSGMMSIYSMYLGIKLGLYQSLVHAGPATASELAARTATHERYIREWLEQQTVANILSVEDETLPAAARRYHLRPGRAESLTDRESPNYVGAIPQVIVGAVKPLEELLAVYRDGGGVPFDHYGEDMREGQAESNRWGFMHQLAQEWLPAAADVHKRLQRADPPARVADIGCGFGWSSIGIALGYPHARVDGFDLDAPSIERAARNALENGVADRVSFQARDASDPALAGQYDLVIALDCVHDFSDPVSALRSMGRLAGPGGAVIIVDERAGESFTAAGAPAEPMMYAASILHCLPVGMTGPNPAGTGTVMRPDTLRAYARLAGFSDIEILPVEDFMFRVYRLVR